MSGGPTDARSHAVTVESFVRRFRTEILAAWKTRARSLAAARQMNALALVDHVPELLEQIAELADAVAAGGALDEPLAMARRHAIDRLQAGFDVSAVVEELSMLRGCVLDVWLRENPSGNAAELRALDLAIDHAVSVSVARYAEARERTLTAIDQISIAALESRSVDDLLHRLLQVFVETSPAVDTAAILLREGDRLRVRAVVGLEEELVQGFSLAIGEGFAGRVAAQRTPLFLRSAYLDPMIASDVVRRRRVRALYGVPLVQGDQLIGVAHMGSVTADELSSEDRQFFASLAARATIAIDQHLVRQERERALAKLESLLAASPVGIAFLDRDLRYLRVNDALAKLNGRSRAEHIGKTVAEVIPTMTAELEPMLRSVIERGEAQMNCPITRPDGRSLLVNYFPVRSSSGEILGIGAIVVDVTKERRAEEALHVEQARLQSILDHAPASIWIKDADGRIVLANDRLASALGHPSTDLVGRRSEDVLPPADAAQHREHDLVVMRENRAIEVEENVPSPDGVRTFLSIKFPIPGDPPLVGGIATEITERKRMEDQLRAAVRMREDVLAIVSHDLRNPLGAIQLSVSMLQGLPQPDHRLRRHLELIHRSSVRMEALIEDLLDTANIGAGRLALDRAPESVEAVLGEGLELQRLAAQEKGIALVRECRARDTTISCDRDRVLQVFGNLIGNAIKFCRAGDSITVTADRDGDAVRFAVADTGPGIAPEMVPHLFDAYWSGHESKQGAGLGLYISRGIVESHGGRIWVESTPGQGATFFFTLPVV